MPWTYRVMKTSYTYADGEVETTYGIHECFYEGEENRDKPWNWTSEPVGIVGDTEKSLREEVMGMVLRAFNEGTLDTSQEPGPGGPDPIDESKLTSLEDVIKELDDSTKPIE